MINQKIKIEIAVGLVAVIALATGLYIWNSGQEVESDISAMEFSRRFKPGLVCVQDAKACPDGSYVSRVAPTCKFAACPEVKNDANLRVCTQEVKQCSDGTYVSHTGPNCEFSACPKAVK